MANKREIIDIPGLAHNAPIPLGAKIGGIVYSSAISGRDAGTGNLPDDPDLQAELLFRNIRTFMKNAGGTADHIIHMTLFLKEEKYRESINKEWIKMFPNEKDRPARHALTTDIRGKVLFQIELVAVL